MTARPQGGGGATDSPAPTPVWDAAYGAEDRIVRVGVLSDTHVPDKCSRIPGDVLRAFEGVDVILHGGDLISLGVLKILERLAPVEAVWGNNDPQQVIDELKERRILKVGGALIGLVHGHRGRGRNTPDRAVRAFREPLDALVFGHSHLPVLVPKGTERPYKKHDEPLPYLLLNPGSPTDRRHAPRRSYAMLEVEGGEVRGS